MPRLKFSDIYSTVESIAKIPSSKRDIVKRGIQMGLDRATSNRDLPYLMTPGVILTVAPYETGTVSITDGSATVTGSGTTFTSDMVGRKIRINNENTYYRIDSFSSETSINLDVAYTGTTDSSLSYSIYKDEYLLPSDMSVYKVMRQLADEQALGSVESTAFDIVEPSPSTTGKPDYDILRGTKLDTYTTGTVSGTVNTTTITGSNTSWDSVEGLAKGSRITIGTNVYTVKSVDSDTQITIYETLVVTVSASAYTVLLDNYIIQFFDIPDDEHVIRFFYQRIAYPLINDEDIPDLPDEWQHILITAGLIWAWATKDKDESKAQETIFKLLVGEMWTRIGHPSRNRSYPRKSQDEEVLEDGPGYARLPSDYNYS